MMSWESIEKAAGNFAGLVGALVSMKFLSGPLTARLIMALGGAAFSFFASEYVSAKLSLPEGLAGFLLGLFGMSILSRLWEVVQSGSIAELLIKLISPKK